MPKPIGRASTPLGMVGNSYAPRLERRDDEVTYYPPNLRRVFYSVV